MFKLRCILIALALTGPAKLNAAALDDYAFQARLGPADASLQRVVLPAQIIQHLAQRNYQDLAIFNADGKVLPQSVIATPSAVSEHEIGLPFHEFDTFLQESSQTVTRREQNQQGGQLSELATTEIVTVESVRKDYLIELRPDDKRREFDSIELDWRHEPAGQMLKLRVEAGDELDRLRTIVAQKSLTRSAAGDSAWRSLQRISGKQRYLRLTAINDVEMFELRGVTGHYRETAAPPRVVVEIEPQITSEDGVSYYRFELPSAVAPEAMRILPAEPNSVISGDLYLQRSDREHRSLVRRGFRQHNLAGADVRAAEPLKLPGNRFDEIWFSTRDELDTAPAVELLYRQRELVFLADGNGPYTLAWGNHEVTSPPPDLRGLVEADLDRTGDAAAAVTLLAIEEAGGISRLQPEPALPWKKWLLWALLIAAALIAGRMAFGLYREMNPAAQ